MEKQTFYISKLKENLSLKQRKNPHYSLRAFSRDLDIHSSTLSQILQGKRDLPFKRAYDIAAKLELSPKEKALFMDSYYRSRTNLKSIKAVGLDDHYLLDESYYKVIAEWEHFAVLELFEFENATVDVSQVAMKLDLTTNRADVVMKNLLDAGLIKSDDNGNTEKTYSDIKTTEDISSSALKKSHKETLAIGIDKLDEIDIELRDFSSTTVAIDLEKIPEAKNIIREFRQKMDALLKNGNKTEVYQLAIQFYPLTKVQTTEKLQ